MVVDDHVTFLGHIQEGGHTDCVASTKDFDGLNARNAFRRTSHEKNFVATVIGNLATQLFDGFGQKVTGAWLWGDVQAVILLAKAGRNLLMCNMESQGRNVKKGGGNAKKGILQNIRSNG